MNFICRHRLVFSSGEIIGEMAESYWMAILRSALHSYKGHPDVMKAVANLNSMLSSRGQKDKVRLQPILCLEAIPAVILLALMFLSF